MVPENPRQKETWGVTEKWPLETLPRVRIEFLTTFALSRASTPGLNMQVSPLRLSDFVVTNKKVSSLLHSKNLTFVPSGIWYGTALVGSRN